jgi:hypothetical protein
LALSTVLWLAVAVCAALAVPPPIEAQQVCAQAGADSGVGAPSPAADVAWGVGCGSRRHAVQVVLLDLLGVLLPTFSAVHVRTSAALAYAAVGGGHGAGGA